MLKQEILSNKQDWKNRKFCFHFKKQGQTPNNNNKIKTIILTIKIISIIINCANYNELKRGI
mgnify:CR=1 FL=1